ncbi:MAG TPA: diadenylate cyclase CdaA [Erysipelothrix sp.]|nr:diadenylate cyclase CdaA [Erysipelothrix sp.]
MPLNILSLDTFLRAINILVDFFIVWILIFYTLRVVRNNSRTVQIFKGVVLIVLVRFIAYYFGLKVVLALADFVIQYGVLVFVIIFQQEIRGLLERLGKTTVLSSLHSLSGNEKEKLIDELVSATSYLSQERVGALITLEQGHSLTDFIKTGTPINSSVTADLLTSLFVTTTPLHDGAVIIQGGSIACASAYFPTTSLDLPARLGARHRAALGVSEITDSVTIVVSEETGTISIAENGKLTEMDESSLREFLSALIQNTETEISNRIDFKPTKRLNLRRMNVDPLNIERVDEEEMKIPSFFKREKKEKKSTKDERESLKSIFDKSKDKEEDKDKKETRFFKKHRVKEEVKPEESDLDNLKNITSRHKEEGEDGGRENE